MTQRGAANLASDRPCCNAAFGATQMQDELGTMSSHPAYSALRMLVWGLVAIAPLFAGVLLVVGWLLDGSTDPVRFLINHGRVITVYGLSAAGFALGFGLTAFAATVAARSLMLVADADVHRDPSVARFVVATLVMLFLLGLAAWAVPLLMDASSQTRLLVAWLGLLPLVLLLSLATFLPHEDSAGRLVRRPLRFLALILPAAVVSLVVATRLQVASEWLQQWAPVRVPLQLFLDMANTAGLDPNVVDSMRSWLVTGIVGVAAIPLLGLALTAVSLLGKGLRVIAGGVGPQRPEPRMWRGDLLASLWTDEAGTPPEEIQGSDVAGEFFTAGDPCNVFFAERPVTREQAAAFNQIASLADEHLASSPAVPARQSRSADFILEGPEGSGRTATMIAALVHGALNYGDTALVLVADEARRDALIMRLTAATRSLLVDGFIGVGPLTDSAVTEWADQAAAKGNGTSPGGHEATKRETKVPPRILVGTLGNLEKSVFGSAYHFDALNQMLGSLSTVAIDDVDRFGIPDRLHLPYVLTKLRLILAAEGQVMRTLVTIKQVAAAARELVARQLLKTNSSDKHTAQLHHLPLAEGMSLSISMLSRRDGRRREAVDQLALCGRACVGRRLNLTVVAPRFTDAERTEVSARCQEAIPAEAGNTVHVVDTVDALPTLGSADHATVASAVCSVIGRRDVEAIAVAWQSDDPTAAVFCITTDEPELAAPEPSHSLLVLPGKESESLFVQHFASAARFVPHLHPVPRWCFSAMGLPSAGTLAAPPADERPQADGLVPLPDRVIALDPPESEVATISADPVRWPWCALRQYGDGAPPSAHAVSIADAVPIATATELSDSGTVLTLLERPPVRSRQKFVGDQRTAIWRATDGAEIARDDLAYMSCFELEVDGGLFVPTQFESSPNGPVVIDARPISYKSRARMPVMPAFELRGLPIPSGIRLKRLLQSAPLAHRVSVLGLVSGDGESRAPTGFTNSQTATLRLRGLYDQAGRLRDWDLQACYEAAKFFVLFDAAEAIGASEVLHEQLLRDWGSTRPETHLDFPELAAAITAAMRWQAPGLERLVRCLGFRITQDEDRPLVGLVFIEPRSTESSGFAIMEPIVYDVTVMSEFFAYAATVIEQAFQSENPAAALYGKAGSVINAAETNGQLTVTTDGMRLAATLLRSIAEESSQLPPG